MEKHELTKRKTENYLRLNKIAVCGTLAFMGLGALRGLLVNDANLEIILSNVKTGFQFGVMPLITANALYLATEYNGATTN